MPLSQSVLGNVTLGFEPLWNRWRKVCGYRLWVEAPQHTAVDAQHLLQALGENYHPTEQRPLLLHVRSQALLQSLLNHPAVPGIWLSIHPDSLSDALWAGQVRAAQARGNTLVWHGEPGTQPHSTHAPWFAHQLHALDAHQALAALRSALRQQHDPGFAPPQTGASPVLPGALYEGLASPALVEHALDQQQARAVVGWPVEEVLYDYRYRQLQPAHGTVQSLVQALDKDETLERMEQCLGHDPLLTYRFLRWMNSAGLGLQRSIESVRQGLQTVGTGRLREWLMAQLPHTCTDPNLLPVRWCMVLRARIMEQLCEAGAEEGLRREVFVCGLFSQVDLLLGEPLGSAMSRLPLPGRVSSAILGQTGPYAPWLDVASVLETSNTRLIREVCHAHGISQESANRALLRALAGMHNT